MCELCSAAVQYRQSFQEYYNDSVNLDEVRDRAQNDLGMVYASPEQIVEYENPATDYVKQYEEIPKDGVLAQSDKTSR